MADSGRAGRIVCEHADDHYEEWGCRPRRVLSEWEKKYGQIDYEDVPPCR